MKRLIVTVGLPGAGKSTWARKFSKEHGIPIVNPDSVRLAIHGQKFITEAEGFVWATVRAMVKSLFIAGHDTIIFDATNITRKRRAEWKSEEWKTVFVVFNTSKEECKARVIIDGSEEKLATIERMSKEQEDFEMYDPYVTPENDCLLVSK